MEDKEILTPEDVKELAPLYEAVVLAQGSMLALEPLLKDFDVPVLTSPRLGVDRAREMLGL